MNKFPADFNCEACQEQSVAHVVDFINTFEKMQTLRRECEVRRPNAPTLDDAAACCNILQRHSTRVDQPEESYGEVRSSSHKKEACALVIEHVPKMFQKYRQVRKT